MTATIATTSTRFYTGNSTETKRQSPYADSNSYDELNVIAVRNCHAEYESDSDESTCQAGGFSESKVVTTHTEEWVEPIDPTKTSIALVVGHTGNGPWQSRDYVEFPIEEFYVLIFHPGKGWTTKNAKNFFNSLREREKEEILKVLTADRESRQATSSREY